MTLIYSMYVSGALDTCHLFWASLVNMNSVRQSWNYCILAQSTHSILSWRRNYKNCWLLKASKSHTQQMKNWNSSTYLTRSNKRESLTDVQHSAVHKTANRFLFSAHAISTLFELFHPPPSSLIPLIFFPPSLPARSTLWGSHGSPVLTITIPTGDVGIEFSHLHQGEAAGHDGLSPRIPSQNSMC